MAQLLVPFAATLAPEAERGRVVGTVMSGLILGILLARTFSGLVSAGRRAGAPSTSIAAVLMLVQTVVLYVKLPRYRQFGRAAVSQAPGVGRSAIARGEPVLRRRALYGVFSFATFSVLWTTLAFLLAGPHVRVQRRHHRPLRPRRRGRRAHRVASSAASPTAAGSTGSPAGHAG